jgi:hypothetical protein
MEETTVFSGGKEFILVRGSKQDGTCVAQAAFLNKIDKGKLKKEPSEKFLLRIGFRPVLREKK